VFTRASLFYSYQTCGADARIDNPHWEGDASALHRALVIVDGLATLRRTVVRGHSAGAIAIDSAVVTLVECMIHDSRAVFGGAIRVFGRARVMISRSNIIHVTAVM
jgi:hypothetical protein